MAFDSVFNGDPRTAGVSSSGKATNGIDVSSGQVYFKDDAVGGWQPTAGGNGGSLPVSTVTVVLTASQINQLVGTPIQVLPALPSNEIYLVLSGTLQYNYAGQVFGNANAAVLNFSLGGQSVISFEAGVLAQVSSQFSSAFNGGGSTTTSTAAGQPLLLNNTNGSDTTGGAGATVAVTLLYSIITLV